MRRIAWAACIAWVAPEAAHAANPCICDPPWSFPAPAETLPDAAPEPLPHVPRNAVFFVTWVGNTPEWFEVVKEDGTSVAVTAEAASDDPGQFWIRPAAPLEAGATYRLDDQGDNAVSFVVDDVLDITPPDHERVQAQPARLVGRCPDHVAAEVRALGPNGTALAGEEPYGLLYELTVRRQGGGAGENPRHFFVRGARPYFGEVITDDYRFQECFENYQGAEPGWDYEVTTTVYDQAGNPGAATHPGGDEAGFRFAYNVSEGCGCRVAPRPGFPSSDATLLLALAVALVVTRRR